MNAAALLLPLLLVVGGLALVRLGWDGHRGIAHAGWGVAVAALAWLGVREGAWGVAVGVVAGTAAALAALAHAGWTAPVHPSRPARQATTVVQRFDGRDLLRRLAVFVLAAPAAFVAAQWLAFGAQAAARRGGAGEADATALMLALQPLLWGLLMAWQMTRPTPTRMIAPPLAAAVLGTVLWGVA